MSAPETTLLIDSAEELPSSDPMTSDQAPLLQPPASKPALQHSPSSSPSGGTQKRFASRALSPEFICYYVLLLWAHYVATMALYDAGNALQPHGLVDGWILGRKRDNRDYQLRFFRDNLALLAAAFLVFVVISQSIRQITSNSFSARIAYYAVFSSCFMVFCNGSGVGFMLAIISCNYAIAMVTAGHWLCSALTWTFNASILLLNERYDGYRYGDIFGVSYGRGRLWQSTEGQTGPLPSPGSRCALPVVLVVVMPLGYLDGWRGLFGWQTLFNLVVLRMISFNLDYHWAVQSRLPASPSPTSPSSFSAHRASCLDCAQQPASPCAAWRSQQSHPFVLYNPVTYYAYLCYPPLHFAGPTITFNHFISNIQSPHTLPLVSIALYALRLGFALLVLELLLHYLWVFSLAQPHLLAVVSVHALLGLVYWTLNGIWLKFLVIWRFMRLFALLDGVEPVENMLRCVDNNHSVQQFWREWHRSFNRWLIRYIYMPMGGNLSSSSSAAASSPVLVLLRRVLNVFVVFTWVAYWHDRTLQLLAWGWLISLLFVPELLAGHVVSLTSLPSSPHYRHVQAAAGAVNILLMMLGNLVGYSVGIGGTLEVLTRVMADGLWIWCVMFVTFFAATQLQLEWRRWESWKRHRLTAQLGLTASARGKTAP